MEFYKVQSRNCVLSYPYGLLPLLGLCNRPIGLRSLAYWHHIKQSLRTKGNFAAHHLLLCCAAKLAPLRTIFVFAAQQASWKSVRCNLGERASRPLIRRVNLPSTRARRPRSQLLRPLSRRDAILSRLFAALDLSAEKRKENAHTLGVLWDVFLHGGENGLVWGRKQPRLGSEMASFSHPLAQPLRCYVKGSPLRATHII